MRPLDLGRFTWQEARRNYYARIQRSYDSEIAPLEQVKRLLRRPYA